MNYLKYSFMQHTERPVLCFIKEKWTRQDELTLPDMLVSLIEIRRYIDNHHRNEEDFRVAKFYCDWALHNQLDRNDFAQHALNVINRNFRSPIKYIEEPNYFLQTIAEALSYHKVGHQIGYIIREITASSFSVNNKFMRMLLTCLIGIPLIPRQTSRAEQVRKLIDVEIDDDCKRAFQKHQRYIDFNVITGIQSNNRICNFTILRIIDNHMDFSIELERGETISSFVEFGTL